MTEFAFEPVAFGRLASICVRCGNAIMQEADQDGRLSPMKHDCPTGIFLLQTPDEIADLQRKADKAAHELDARRQAVRGPLSDWLDTLAGVTNPIALAVLNLHTTEALALPDRFSYAASWTCDGDDMDGYECEAPSWPCETVKTVMATLGYPLPEDYWLLIR